MSRDPILEHGNILLRVLGNMQQAKVLHLIIASLRSLLSRNININPEPTTFVTDYCFVRNSTIRGMDLLGMSHADTPCPQLPGSVNTCLPSGKKQSSKTMYSNGCGSHAIPVPDNPVGLPGCSFSTACDYHDCCYGACGASKDGCDIGFWGRMMEQCATCGVIYGPLILSDCIGLAYIHSVISNCA